MRFKAEVAGTEHSLTVQPRDENFAVEVDGRTYEVHCQSLGSGEYLIIENSNIYHCRVQTHRGPAEPFTVELHGHSYEIKIIDPKRLRSGRSASGQGHGAAQIVAPMPGKVVRCLVEIGARVELGQGIIVVEAMKMQNEMKAPKAGTVTALNAAPYRTVNAGDILVVIE